MPRMYASPPKPAHDAVENWWEAKKGTENEGIPAWRGVRWMDEQWVELAGFSVATPIGSIHARRARAGMDGVTQDDCLRCGACCCNPDENRAEGFAYWVEVPEGTRLLSKRRLVQRYVVHDSDGVAHLRLDDQGRCTALRGRLGQAVHCTIYEDRPRGCRQVEAGSERCLQYRAERGVAPTPRRA